MDKTEHPTLLKELAGLLREVTGEPIDRITPKMQIVKDLGLDSFSIIELLYEIEMKYKIKISEEALKKIHTVEDVTQLIRPDN